MKLDEVMGYVAPYKWDEVYGDFGCAGFVVNDKEYSVIFTFYEEDMDDHALENLPDRWDIEFSLDKQEGGITIGTHNITHTGDQFKVFSTVIAIAKEWFTRNPTRCITMLAKEPSRKKLYSALLRKLLPGWDIQLHHSVLVALNNKSSLS